MLHRSNAPVEAPARGAVDVAREPGEPPLGLGVLPVAALGLRRRGARDQEVCVWRGEDEMPCVRGSERAGARS